VNVKSRVLPVLSVALLGAVLTGQARATVINFDNLSNGTILTNQYAGLGVTFGSSGGDSIYITAQNPPYTGTAPNLICTGGVPLALGTVDCSHDVIINFSSPANNVHIDAFGNQTTTGMTFALADVFQNGVLTHQNLNLIVTHTDHNAGCPGPPNTTPDCAPDPQDFSAFPGITELLIHNNTDTNGTAYDNLSFTLAAVPGPEPSTLFLMGFGGFAWAGRRFLARKSR